MKAFVLFYVLGRIWDAVGGGKNANELKGARVVDSRNVAGRKWEILSELNQWHGVRWVIDASEVGQGDDGDANAPTQGALL